MEKQILYGSEYGTAKAYAEKCAELTGIPAKSYEEADSLEGCDLLIYFGGLYAGGVKGLKATLKKVGKESNLILVTVGLADVEDEENITHIRQSLSKQIPAEMLEHTQIFHLRGGIDYSRLNFKHKTMMTLLYNKAKNLPEEKKTADARAMVETFGKQVSFVNFESLNPILNAIADADPILETERLFLRRMTQGDYANLCRTLQDEKAMYAYEGAFADAEVQEWLDRQLARYEKYGFGLWSVVLKETGEFIGQCGLTMQPWKDQEVLEIGYLLERKYWHHGYITEAAEACKEYAFTTLDADEVCSIIRDTNTASQNVAIRNGMAVEDTWTKHYRGVDMPHLRYVVHR